MVGLIYKDFLVNKKSIFIALGAMIYCGMMVVIPAGNKSVKEDMGMFMQLYGILIFFAMFIISGNFQGNIFKSDESKKWAYFIISTPMIKKYIEAKYWFIMIMSLSTLLITAIFDSLNCIVSDAYSLQIFIMIMFYIQILMRSIEIPFLIRFGAMGSYYKVGIFLLAVLAVGIYLLFGDLSHFGSMDSFYEWIFKALGGESMAFQVFFAILPFVSATAYYLSYKVSCRLYLEGGGKL